MREYSVNGVVYLELPTWKTHQYVNRAYPSKLPDPPWFTPPPEDDGADPPGVLTEDSVSDAAVRNDVDVDVDIGTGGGVDVGNAHGAVAGGEREWQEERRRHLHQLERRGDG